MTIDRGHLGRLGCGLLCGCVIMLCWATDVGAVRRRSTRIDRLVTQSERKKTLMQSKTGGDILEAAEVREAVELIGRRPDYRSYHLLFALRQSDSKAYAQLPAECKAAVIASALASLTFLNDFGYLDPVKSYDREVAKVLIEIGKPAVKELEPLLDDRGLAPLYGSEVATESQTYGYRRYDFAYRYILRILGREPAFDADPKKRDIEIQALKKALRK